MNAKELTNFFTENLDEDLGFDPDQPFLLEDYFKKPKQIKGYEFKTEERFGGEGQGDDYWFVVSVKEIANGNIRYFQYWAFHDSWEGSTFYDAEPQEVEPKEVTVIKWFEKE